jgi:hypothetical protein
MRPEAEPTPTAVATTETTTETTTAPASVVKTVTIPETSKRTFSKRMVVINSALAWAAVFVSIIYMQAAYVAATAMFLILALGGTYMGIGHMDLKQILKSMIPGPLGMTGDELLPASEPPKDFAG